MSTELTAKVKALITSKGGTPSEAEGLVTSDIKQFVEIAQLYYGVLPSLTLISLAYPDNIPANLKAALDGGSEEPGEGEDPEQPEDPAAKQSDGDDTSDTSGQAGTDTTDTSDQGDTDTSDESDAPDQGAEDTPAEGDDTDPAGDSGTEEDPAV